jgi:hypothetical protein
MQPSDFSDLTIRLFRLTESGESNYHRDSWCSLFRLFKAINFPHIASFRHGCNQGLTLHKGLLLSLLPHCLLGVSVRREWDYRYFLARDLEKSTYISVITDVFSPWLGDTKVCLNEETIRCLIWWKERALLLDKQVNSVEDSQIIYRRIFGL